MQKKPTRPSRPATKVFVVETTAGIPLYVEATTPEAALAFVQSGAYHQATAKALQGALVAWKLPDPYRGSARSLLGKWVLPAR
jgi:hypothetical protein